LKVEEADRQRNAKIPPQGSHQVRDRLCDLREPVERKRAINDAPAGPQLAESSLIPALIAARPRRVSRMLTELSQEVLIPPKFLARRRHQREHGPADRGPGKRLGN